MTSNKPYLVRAIHEWCKDQDFTTHLLVNSTVKDTVVPTEFIEADRIVLNISEEATRDLRLDNQLVEFLANFNQNVVKVSVPMEAIIAVYAHETGEGVTFGDDEDESGSCLYEGDIDNDISDNDASIGSDKKPKLTLIK